MRILCVLLFVGIVACEPKPVAGPSLAWEHSGLGSAEWFQICTKTKESLGISTVSCRNVEDLKAIPDVGVTHYQTVLNVKELSVLNTGGSVTVQACAKMNFNNSYCAASNYMKWTAESK